MQNNLITKKDSMVGEYLSFQKRKPFGEKKMMNNIINKEMRVEGEKPRFFSSKGIVHIDYIIAAGAFLIAFAFVVQYTITYFENVREISDIVAVRSEAIELLGIVDRGFLPKDWPEIPSDDSSLVLLLHFYKYD